MASLKDKKRSAANNSAGAQWEQSIGGEMSPVTEKHRALDNVDLQQIGALRGAIAELQRAR